MLFTLKDLPQPVQHDDEVKSLSMFIQRMLKMYWGSICILHGWHLGNLTLPTQQIILT